MSKFKIIADAYSSLTFEIVNNNTLFAPEDVQNVSQKKNRQFSG